jgi:methyl-accepting chemotaxis protein
MKLVFTFLVALTLMCSNGFAAPTEAKQAYETQKSPEKLTGNQVDGAHVEAGHAETMSAGKFDEPKFEQASRARFGPEAGNATQYSLDHHEVSNAMSSYQVFFYLTIVVGLITLLATLYFTKVESEDGSTTRGITLASKLVGGFGTLATLILVVSTMSLKGFGSSQESMDTYSDIVADSALLGALQSDVLMVRMNTKDFLITNSDKDLEQYSDFIASAYDKLSIAESEVKNPERVEMIKSIHHELDQYSRVFTQVVNEIDMRNGLIDSQMTPTAEQVMELLVDVAESASADGDLGVSSEVFEASLQFEEAQLAMYKYNRSGDLAHKDYAIKSSEEAIEYIHKAEESIEDQVRFNKLEEAIQGIKFYDAQLEQVVKHIENRNKLVQGSLDIVGPKIAQLGADIVGSISNTRTELQSHAKQVNQTSGRTSQIASFVSIGLAVFCAFFITRSILTGVNKIVERIRDVAEGEGDLTKRVEVTKDELGVVATWFNAFVQRVHDTIYEVSKSAETVAAAATQIAASSDEMSKGMQNQQMQSNQVSAAVEQMSASVREVAQNAKEATEAAKSGGNQAQDGGDIVEKTIVGMNAINCEVAESSNAVSELGKRGEEIGEVISVINDIADQTNLLALNAAIEAARAGEHGRGFAVVADEVRKLAERTTQATQEVADSIQAIQCETKSAVGRMSNSTDRVSEGVEFAQQAGESLTSIVSSSKGVASMIESIAAAADQQSAASTEISRNVEQINAVTNESAQGVAQAAEAANQLSVHAEELQSLVGQFKLNA